MENTAVDKGGCRNGTADMDDLILANEGSMDPSAQSPHNVYLLQLCQDHTVIHLVENLGKTKVRDMFDVTIFKSIDDIFMVGHKVDLASQNLF